MTIPIPSQRSPRTQAIPRAQRYASSSKALSSSIDPTGYSYPKENPLFQPSQSMQLLDVLEGLMDGILIVGPQGNVISANRYGMDLCRQIGEHQIGEHQIDEHNEDSEYPGGLTLPKTLWHLCKNAMHQPPLPQLGTLLDEEIVLPDERILRIRARWVQMNAFNDAQLLVMLEDRRQSFRDRVLAEARAYHLTVRETDVWLLRRSHHSYKAIATKLHISLDTVKKHLKSIYAKREGSMNRPM